MNLFHSFEVMEYLLYVGTRLLEEGKVDESDKRKDEVEEKQRERRKILGKKGEDHIAHFFR